MEKGTPPSPILTPKGIFEDSNPFYSIIEVNLCFPFHISYSYMIYTFWIDWR